MSWDIRLTDKDNEEFGSLNYLRNPFGLCNWAEDNVGDGKNSLYKVLNKVTYKNIPLNHRKKMLEFAEEYYKKIESLEEGYFYFDLTALVQFILPHSNLLISTVPKDSGIYFFTVSNMTKIDGAKYNDDYTKFGIPMHLLSKKEFNLGEDVCLTRWKDWFFKLLTIIRMSVENPKWKCEITN